MTSESGRPGVAQTSSMAATRSHCVEFTRYVGAIDCLRPGMAVSISTATACEETPLLNGYFEEIPKTVARVDQSPVEARDAGAARRGDVKGGAHPGSLLAFEGTEGWLRCYDGGEYSHSPIGGSGALSSDYYGETCIPESYVRRRWSDRFEVS